MAKGKRLKRQSIRDVAAPYRAIKRYTFMCLECGASREATAEEVKRNATPWCIGYLCKHKMKLVTTF